MYIRLIRNKAKGNAITGRLVIDGRWFCNTLERKGYQILALCYSVRVTMSPKFKRLLPIIQNVPASPKSSPKGKDFNSEEKLPSLQGGAGVGSYRSGIRFHRGSKPEHSTGCILVPKDKEIELTNIVKNAQSNEEIILEVIDYSPGTEYGYNTPYSSELQKR